MATSMQGDLGVAEMNLVTDGAKFLTDVGSSLQDIVPGIEPLWALSVRCVTVVRGFSARIVVEAPRAFSVRCVIAGDELVLTGIRTLNECPICGDVAPGGIATEAEYAVDPDLAERGSAPFSTTAKGGGVPGPTMELVKIVLAGVADTGELQGKLLLAARMTMKFGCDENCHRSLYTCSNCCGTLQA